MDRIADDRRRFDNAVDEAETVWRDAEAQSHGELMSQLSSDASDSIQTVQSLGSQFDIQVTMRTESYEAAVNRTVDRFEEYLGDLQVEFDAVLQEINRDSRAELEGLRSEIRAALEALREGYETYLDSRITALGEGLYTDEDYEEHFDEDDVSGQPDGGDEPDGEGPDNEPPQPDEPGGGGSGDDPAPSCSPPPIPDEDPEAPGDDTDPDTDPEGDSEEPEDESTSEAPEEEEDGPGPPLGSYNHRAGAVASRGQQIRNAASALGNGLVTTFQSGEAFDSALGVLNQEANWVLSNVTFGLIELDTGSLFGYEEAYGGGTIVGQHTTAVMDKVSAIAGLRKQLKKELSERLRAKAKKEAVKNVDDAADAAKKVASNMTMGRGGAFGGA